MRRLLFAGGLLLAISLYAASLLGQAEPVNIVTDLRLAMTNPQEMGFARADQPRDWHFPRDFGAHPDFQTEWWYYNGNLFTEDGRHFGFHLSFFRRALVPGSMRANAEQELWRSEQIYMAHFSLSDINRAEHRHEQRFERGAAGLAGAQSSPNYRVWLADWVASATASQPDQRDLFARMADGTSLSLRAAAAKAPVFHGDGGLSAKGVEVGNASHYYSLTRMLAEGEVQFAGRRYTVSGNVWMDHEFSTSALSEEAVGWDWFALQLDDGRELMLGRIRYEDSNRISHFSGSYVHANGHVETLAPSAFQIEVLENWLSPHSGAQYPAGWKIVIQTEADTIRLELHPLIADQEILGAINYWEGALRIRGDATGYGFAELTGYDMPMGGLF